MIVGTEYFPQSVIPAKVTQLRHPGESRDPLNKIRRAVLLVLKTLMDPGFRQDDDNKKLAEA